MSDNQKWSILQGDALKVLGTFDPNTFDAVITDPPYASGGRTQAEKNKSTAQKYSSMGENAPPPFDGDAKDQRSWTRWAAEWLYLARSSWYAAGVKISGCSITRRPDFSCIFPRKIKTLPFFSVLRRNGILNQVTSI